MATLPIEPSGQAQEAVLIANTPSFLFSRLREDSVVRYIADTHSPEEIKKWFEMHSESPKDALEIVLRYMYLIALSLKKPKEVFGLIRSLPLVGLEWGPQIVALIEAMAMPANSMIVDLRPMLKSPSSFSSAQSGSLLVPDLKPHNVKIVR